MFVVTVVVILHGEDHHVAWHMFMMMTSSTMVMMVWSMGWRPNPLGWTMDRVGWASHFIFIRPTIDNRLI